MAKTQNYKQAKYSAQKEAEALQVDQFGTSDFEKMTEGLYQAVTAFAERVRINAENERHFVTGEMVRLQAEKNANGSIDVFGYDYLLYQDQGINGSVEKHYDTPFEFKDKMPPIEPIREWCKAKGLPAGYEWYVQKKIFREGIPPTRVMTRELDQLVEDAAEYIANFTIDNITFNNL